MKLYAIAALTIFAGWATAVTLPACAASCVTNSIPASCGVDAKCICQASSFIEGATCCVAGVCDAADQNATIQYAESICGAVGITDLPTTATCASTASSTGTAAASSSISSAATNITAGAVGSSVTSAASSAGSSATSAVSSAASSASTALTSHGGVASAASGASGSVATSASASASSVSTGAATSVLVAQGMSVVGVAVGAVMVFM